MRARVRFLRSAACLPQGRACDFQTRVVGPCDASRSAPKRRHGALIPPSGSLSALQKASERRKRSVPRKGNSRPQPAPHRTESGDQGLSRIARIVGQVCKVWHHAKTTSRANENILFKVAAMARASTLAPCQQAGVQALGCSPRDCVEPSAREWDILQTASNPALLAWQLAQTTTCPCADAAANGEGETITSGVVFRNCGITVSTP